MATIPPLKLTAKIAEEIRADLAARIPSITNRWTDFNDHEQGMVLLTLLSGMLETGNFELNMRASELTAKYVRQRPNAVRLFKLIGYNLKRKIAAKTTIKLTLSSAHSVAIPIAPYYDATPTVCKTKTQTALSFTSVERSSLPAGSKVVTFVAYQGTKGTNTFTPDSNPDQIFALSGQNIAEGFVRVKVNGINWAEVESFYASKIYQ